MKTVYNVPKLSSLENEITDFSFIPYEAEELRLVYLNGEFVRIDVDSKNKKIEVNSADEHIDLSKYKDALSKLFDFFYGDGYLFGIVKDNKLEIYDIYANDNYFSTRDMAYLEENYKLPIVKPIYEGKFSFEDIITIFHKKIQEGLNGEELHVFPAMYLNDKRTYSTYSEDITTTLLVGEEEPETPIWNGEANTYSAPVRQKSKVLGDILKATTKEERVHIFQETTKNVKDYMEKSKELSNDSQKLFFKNYGLKFCWLYSLLTLPSTRHIIYDYAKSYNYLLFCRTNQEKWAQLFMDFFYEEMFDELAKYIPSEDDYDNFAFVFHDELTEFDKMYVKETDLKDDWRFRGDMNNV